MSENWTVTSLAEALAASEFVTGGGARVEVIEGLESGLHVIMTEYGDLPVFGSVDGDQMVFKVNLWPVDAVSDPATFNVSILRMHKLLPLSTFGLIMEDDGVEYYELFGALSARSRLAAVIQEIETLAENAISVSEWARENNLLEG